LANISIFDWPLVLFQRFIGTLFLLLVGVSLSLSESKNNEGYIKHAKRALKLFAVAFLITIVTWVYPHDGFITFGIIHVIAASTLIAPLFFKFGKMNILIGLILIISSFYISTVETDNGYVFWLGLTTSEYKALDYYPLIPWFGIVLIGIYAGQRVYPHGEPRKMRGESKAWILQKLAFLGRNSLLIYLTHQIVLMGILLEYKILIH
jgi:uncharacterized membrane protein